MLDNKLKPWLLEVNHTPSFATDSPVDSTVKYELIKDTIALINFKGRPQGSRSFKLERFYRDFRERKEQKQKAKLCAQTQRDR